MEKKSGKPPKPFRILVNLFAKSRRQGHKTRSTIDSNVHSPPIIRTPCPIDADGPLDSISMAASNTTNCNTPGFPELYTEIQALHLSRQDNPFIQKASLSQENLDKEEVLITDQSSNKFCSQSIFSGSHSLLSPDPMFSSPTRSSCDPLALEEIHSHMIRSPPPINWPEKSFPLSPRSYGTFSPDSSDGAEMLGDFQNANYYTRSQSEEHILSPCRDLLKVGMFSPDRGATPDLMSTSMTSQGLQESHTGIYSPRNSQKNKIRRNYSCSRDDVFSQTKNQSSFDNGANSISYFANSNVRGGSISKRSIPANMNTSIKRNVNNTKKSGIVSPNDNFFLSWKPRRRRKSVNNDIKSMENLLYVDTSSQRVCSPHGRKSLCSIGAQSPKITNSNATLFTKWKIRDPAPLYIE